MEVFFMKLKFTPTKKWNELFDDLETVVSSIDHPPVVSLHAVFNDIYADKIISPLDPVGRLLANATEAQAQQVIDLFMQLWNMTPRAAFKDKTPNQMAAQLPPQPTIKKAVDTGWSETLELLMNIQGNFQAELYDSLAILKATDQKKVIAYSHRLFERFLHTVLEDPLPNQVAPADLITNQMERTGLKLPRNTQAQVRVYKTPVKNPLPDRRIRTTAGMEEVHQFPLIHDYFNGHKKSEYYASDTLYCRMLAAVGKQQPQTETQVMAAAWRYAVESWRTSSHALQVAYDSEKWQLWLIRQFDLACTEWVSTDDIFDAITTRIHEEVMPMQIVIDQQNAPKGRYIAPSNADELAAYMTMLDIQTSYARDFLSALTTYLPLIETRYIVPLNIAEELADYLGSGENLIDIISKPPSYFALRSPIGAKLWRDVKKEIKKSID